MQVIVREFQEVRKSPKRLFLLLLSLMAIAAIYLFQDRLSIGNMADPNTAFVVKKLLRVTLNDFAVLLFIYTWFQNRQITRLALWIQMIDTCILLPTYLYFKLTLEGDSEISSPFLSQFHRLIVNPTLMLLFIVSIYVQRLKPTE